MADMRKIAVIGALGVGALGLIGVGTGATFTDSVTTSQKVTAGTMNMQLAPQDGSQGTASADGKSVTFTDTPAESSTFTTGAQHVIITNAGNITANAWQISISHTVPSSAPADASAALAKELYVHVTSGSNEIYNGPLSGFEGHPISIQGPLAPTKTDDMAVELYAGSGSAPSLTNEAEGGVVVPTVTLTYQG